IEPGVDRPDMAVHPLIVDQPLHDEDRDDQANVDRHRRRRDLHDAADACYSRSSLRSSALAIFSSVERGSASTKRTSGGPLTPAGRPRHVARIASARAAGASGWRITKATGTSSSMR